MTRLGRLAPLWTLIAALAGCTTPDNVASGPSADLGSLRPSPTGLPTSIEASRPSPSAQAAEVAAQLKYADLSTKLSEPDRYFFSDNLISNETSFLDVGAALGKLATPGGVYLGVGPEQNFSYIAIARPKTAFIVDIRRDNLLLHVFYRACFQEARSRSHFLALVLGRELDAEHDTSETSDIGRVLELAQRADGSPEAHGRVSDALTRRMGSFGLSLTEADRSKITEIRRRFFQEGLGLRFALHESNGRTYPSLADNLRAVGRDGTQSFLADEGAFRFVQELQRAGRVVPVVGDFAGEHAFARLAEYLRADGSAVSVFYVSNVEQYLLDPAKFAAYRKNVAQLPANDQSLFIRAYLDQGRRHPKQRDGQRTATALFRIQDFSELWADKKTTTFWALATERMIEP